MLLSILKTIFKTKIYSYIAIYLGCLIEGEATIVAGSFAAHRGYLNIFLVATVAFVAAQSADWFWFLLGHYKGKKIIRKRPKLAENARRIHTWMHKHHVLLLLGYRFLYGVRLTFPLIIGASSLPVWRFMVFSFLGTLIWASLVAASGYFFGVFITAYLKEIEHYEGLILLGLLIVSLLAGLTIWHFSKKRLNAKDSN
jgi:membrane protein DedA with SNARE-associated domain